jgi:glutaredoxin 3
MKVQKQPQSIILYSRAMCGWCIDAKEWLDKMGWKYEVRDTGKDPSAKKEAIELSGQTCVPVINVDGLILGDFDTGQLEDFLKKNGYLAESVS